MDFCVYFKEQKPVSFKKKQNTGELFFLKKRVFLHSDCLSIFFVIFS